MNKEEKIEQWRGDEEDKGHEGDEGKGDEEDKGHEDKGDEDEKSKTVFTKAVIRKREKR